MLMLISDSALHLFAVTLHFGSLCVVWQIKYAVLVAIRMD